MEITIFYIIISSIDIYFIYAYIYPGYIIKRTEETNRHHRKIIKKSKETYFYSIAYSNSI